MYGLGDSTDLSRYSDTSLTQVRHDIGSFLKENSRASVQFKSIVAQDDPITLFRQLNHRINNSIVEVTEHTDHYQIDLNRKIKRSGRRITGSFAFFSHDGTNVWTALTGHGKDFVEHGLNWVIRECTPEIYEFYATSRDLESVLDIFAKSIDYDAEIIVTQAVAYSHRNQAEISYKTRPYPVVFRKAREGGNYIDSLSLKATTDEGTLLEASLNRDGSTSIQHGKIDLFFNYLLEQYISYGDEKADLFTGKERRHDTGDVQEIKIQFEGPVFQSTQDNEDLIKALADLSRASISVYHKNPYAHISVLDFNDGSSCDVFVTDPKSVSIVPSYRGSTNFLMRISDKLYRELDESTIHYVEEDSVEVEEFIGG